MLSIQSHLIRHTQNTVSSAFQGSARLYAYMRENPIKSSLVAIQAISSVANLISFATGRWFNEPDFCPLNQYTTKRVPCSIAHDFHKPADLGEFLIGEMVDWTAKLISFKIMEFSFEFAKNRASCARAARLVGQPAANP